MKTAIGYTRVSTYEQVTEGLSLETQISKIETYCKLKDLQLVDIISDPGTSGSKPLSDRKGGSELLKLVQSEKNQSIISTKLDRLFRNSRDCVNTIENWINDGISVHLLDINVDTSSQQGKMLITIMSALAEFERQQIIERTQAILAYMKTNHIYTGGGIPYGYMVEDSKVIECESEQITVKLICDLRKQGFTVNKIKYILEKSNFKNRNKKEFNNKQLMRIIKSYGDK